MEEHSTIYGLIWVCIVIEVHIGTPDLYIRKPEPEKQICRLIWLNNRKQRK